jgi:coenzyme F420-0:L-glutamate ligase/coenzyme F420-1:gamma-L-glutamate ligase
MPDAVRIAGLSTIPNVQAGDDLAALIVASAAQQGEAPNPFAQRPVVVVAQKIVSLAEGGVVDLGQVQPSETAREYATRLGKDARLIEVILQNTRRIVRLERDVLIVETHHGLICANAGVDQSNVPGQDRVTVLPRDPDASATRVRTGIKRLCGADCPVIISDTFGRPWRLGLVNVAIGVAGFDPLRDYRGRRDRHGRPLHSTVIALADELAAAAGLMMEKSEGAPVALIYGVTVAHGEGSAKQLQRPSAEDLFR